MTDTRSRKLAIEAKQAKSNNFEGIQYGPVGDSLDTWKATYEGPKESVYEGTTIEVRIQIPKAYPFEAPVMKTDILHPNVYEGTGEVCMSILHNGRDRTGYEKIAERWIPGKGIAACVLGFQQILTCPNFESAANLPVALQFRDNQELLKSRIMNAFIKKLQQIEFDKCSAVDMMNANKRKREMLDAAEAHSSKMVQKRDEAGGSENKKKQDRTEEGSQKKMTKTGQSNKEFPEEPKSGGVAIKFKTKRGDFQRTFDVKNKVISAFNFLGSCGVEAEKISIPVYGKVNTVIDREEAKISTFDDANIKSSIFVYVYEVEEEDDD